MAWESLLGNLVSPPVLFFFLGVVAVAARSDLEVPAAAIKTISLYLLLSIGFKGGVELSRGPVDGLALRALGAAGLLSVLVPLLAYGWLRRRFSTPDAAAVAATYGSVSAVTFVAAISVLRTAEISYGGYMVAALALMEAPAILIGVALARRSEAGPDTIAWPALVRETVANGPVFLLLGSLGIGYLTGDRGRQELAPVVEGLFKGALCLFLLDLGMTSARRLEGLRQAGGFALVAPLASAALALGLGRWCGLPAGDAFLLTVLAASASYIAVPAALRVALPQANPGLYLPMALGVTFPLNIVFGLPAYLAAVRWLWA